MSRNSLHLNVPRNEFWDDRHPSSTSPFSDPEDLRSSLNDLPLTDLEEEIDLRNRLRNYSESDLKSPSIVINYTNKASSPQSITFPTYTPIPTNNNTLPNSEQKLLDTDLDNLDDMEEPDSNYNFTEEEYRKELERIQRAREDTRLYLIRASSSDRDFDINGDEEKPQRKITFEDLEKLEELRKEDEKKWGELSGCEKFMRVGTAIWKTLAILFLLYFFVCSLDLLSLGFRLIGGRTASEIFKNSEILQNPIVGVMIGILTTVLVQSSSTSTSLVVSMVASGFVEVQVAIYIIMGCNIGTSITSTIVAFGQVTDREQFRRAFAGATILDMFNWIAVVVFLPIEALTGYLFHLTTAVMNGIMPESQTGGEIEIITVITKPLVNLIVQLDKSVLECWANPNCTEADDASLLKENCPSKLTEVTFSEMVENTSGGIISQNMSTFIVEIPRKCKYLFAGTSMSDAAVGAIVLISSLIILCTCLVLIVKVLKSVLEGNITKVIQKTLNAEIPYVPWITGYIAILIGAVMTFLVQSSSVFTSALTPLVGLEIISLERMYPLGLGSNIGTTTTALLASMASEGGSFYPAMQIALCHFFFNLSGILLFYPIPYLRLPIWMAKFMGNTTAKYRWFAIFYMIFAFVILPALFIGLSFAGSWAVLTLAGIVCVLVAFIAIVTVLQRKKPSLLPKCMQDWKFLPLPLRSLEPYDRLLSKCNCSCCPCCKKKSDVDGIDNEIEDPYRTDPFVFFPAGPKQMRASNESLDKLGDSNGRNKSIQI